MKHATCTEVREQLLELVPPASHPAPQVEEHVKSCAGCAAELATLQRTMSILDEWEAPEPSVYFDTRLQARLKEAREQQAAGERRGALAWLGVRWQPAVAAVLALFLVISGIAYRNGHQSLSQQAAVVRSTGAAADLQALDKNADVYTSFDMLYDDAAQNEPSSE